MEIAFTIVGVLAVVLNAAFVALTVGVATGASALAARPRTRRWVLVASLAGQLVAVLLVAALPRASALGPAALALGMVGVIVVAALLFAFPDGHAAGLGLGVAAAAIVGLGHQLEIAPMFAAMLAGTGSTMTALVAIGQVAGAVVVLLVALLLVLLRGTWSPIAEGAAVGGLVAALCTLAQLGLARMDGPTLSTWWVSVLTVLGFAVGLLVGVVRRRSVPAAGGGYPRG